VKASESGIRLDDRERTGIRFGRGRAGKAYACRTRKPHPKLLKTSPPGSSSSIRNGRSAMSKLPSNAWRGADPPPRSDPRASA